MSVPSLQDPTSAIEKRDRCADLPHRPRVLLGKMGLDGHDRGVKLIARVLRDAGVHVIYSGLWQTPRSLAIGARDEDADVIACSMMSNSHLVLVPRLLDECRALGRPDMPVNVGGIIPQEDVPTLLSAGVRRIYHTGTGMEEIVQSVRECVRAHAPLQSPSTHAVLARQISLAHAGALPAGAPMRRPARVVGITGSPGAGKSTLVAALAAEAVRRGERVAVVAFDPMSPITGGALLGDRLRVDFNAVDEKVAIVAEAGAHRLADIEMNIRTFFVKVTDERQKTVEGISQMFGVSQELIDASPFALIGSVDSCIEQLLERREKWGFSYTIVGAENIDECAPIVAALRGK